MLGPEILTRVHRRVKGSKLKALVFAAMRTLGLRHLVVRMDTINLCNLRCKCAITPPKTIGKRRRGTFHFPEHCQRSLAKDPLPVPELCDRATDEQELCRDRA